MNYINFTFAHAQKCQRNWMLLKHEQMWIHFLLIYITAHKDSPDLQRHHDKQLHVDWMFFGEKKTVLYYVTGMKSCKPVFSIITVHVNPSNQIIIISSLFPVHGMLWECKSAQCYVLQPVCWSKHVCNTVILPSHWSYTVQTEVTGWLRQRQHSAYYKTLVPSEWF